MTIGRSEKSALQRRVVRVRQFHRPTYVYPPGVAPAVRRERIGSSSLSIIVPDGGDTSNVAFVMPEEFHRQSAPSARWIRRGVPSREEAAQRERSLRVFLIPSPRRYDERPPPTPPARVAPPVTSIVRGTTCLAVVAVVVRVHGRARTLGSVYALPRCIVAVPQCQQEAVEPVPYEGFVRQGIGMIVVHDVVLVVFFPARRMRDDRFARRGNRRRCGTTVPRTKVIHDVTARG